MSRNTDIIRYRFRGAQAPPLVASRNQDFCSLLVGAGGPTVQAVAGGAMRLLIDNDAEVETACLYQGDIYPWDINDLVRVEFLIRSVVAFGAGNTVFWGLAAAQNVDPTAIATAIGFRMTANDNVVIDSRDGTNTVAAAATGQTLGAVYRRAVIDFSSGGLTQDGPTASVGGLADCRFFLSDARGSLRRVAAGQRFRMDAFAGQLQLYAQLNKTAANASVPQIEILGIDVEVKLPR
ncbi:MAG: hypothetical protein WC815_23930 [Vicinamibacterales bacterium]|jgi:hypothetical protein